MNSPARALVWEIFQKNRWGFALLIILLLVCTSMRVAVQRLQADAVRIQESQERVGETFKVHQSGSYATTGSAAQNASADFQLKLDSKLIFRGPFGLDDTISWTGSAATPPALRVFFNSSNIYTGPLPMSGRLEWSNAAGEHGSIETRLTRAYTVEAAEAATLADNWRSFTLTWAAVLLAFSFLVVFGIFGCAEPHPMRGFTGIPSRRFTLPVKTNVLVLAPFLFGSATILALYFAWSWLVFRVLIPDMPDLYLAPLFLSSLAAFQVLVWSLPSFPKIRAVLVILLILSVIPLAALPFSGGFDLKLRISFPSIIPSLMFAAAWLAAIPLAWCGVDIERHGGWSDRQRHSRWSQFITRFLPRPWPFHSPLEAQLWCEWQRNCRLPLLVWTIVVAATFLIGIAISSQAGPAPQSTDPADIIMGIMIPLTIAWTAITGLNIARDTSTKKNRLSLFTAARPVPTGSLLNAKLLAGLLTWLAAVLIFAMATLVFAKIQDSIGVPFGESFLRHFQEPALLLNLALAFAFSLNLLTGILPLSLSGRIPAFPWAFVPWLLVYGGVLNFAIWCESHHHFNWIYIGVVIFVTAKLGVALWGFRRAVEFRWISSGFVFKYVLFWMGTTGILVAFAWYWLEGSGWPSEASILIPIALGVIPLARIALSPTALALNRHG